MMTGLPTVGTGERWVGAWVGTEWQGVGSCWPPTWITSTPCYHERFDTQTTNPRTAMPRMPFSSKGRYSSRGLNPERKSRHKSMLPRRTKRPTSFCQWFLSLKTHVALSLRKTERKSLVSQPLSKTVDGHLLLKRPLPSACSGASALCC